MNYHLSLSIFAIAWFSAALPAEAVLINSYDFNGNFSDTLGRGPNVTPFGGNLTNGRYSFSVNQGLSLNNALASTSSYSIEIKFQINAPSVAWNKLIDFEDRTADAGLYFYSTSATGPFGFQLYPAVLNGPSGIPLNTDAVFRLTRNSLTNEVEGFLNNISQWKFVDAFNYAVPSGNLLTFFRDDTITSQLESFAGSVDYIRISDNPAVIPEPSALVIWLVLGLILAPRFTRFEKHLKVRQDGFKPRSHE